MTAETKKAENDEQLRLRQMQWQKESARLKEYEMRHEAQMARRRKIGLVSLVTVLLVFALVSTVALVRFHRYSKAGERFIVGEYEQAAEAYMQMADYKDAKAWVYMSAVEMFRLKMYEKAYPYFVWLDGYMDNGYYLQKCREKLGLEP